MMKMDKHLLARFDVVLLILVALLCSMGLINLFSGSMSLNAIVHHHGQSPFIKQAVFMTAGFAVCFFVQFFDYQLLQKWNWAIYWAGIVLLVIVDVFGNSAGGAQRWIDLGIIKLQPSEMQKLILVISLASYYARREVADGYGLKDLIKPALFALLPAILVFAQPDLGSAGILLIIALLMTLVAGVRHSTLIPVALIGIIVVVVVWKNVENMDTLLGPYLKAYQIKRIQTVFHPDLADPMGQGYQILQSKIAIGSGGLAGSGYLMGTQAQLRFLPERHTDFAFAVWGEEWGFIGSLFFVGVYMLFLLWGLWIAMRARDRFGVLLAYGVVLMIACQAIINLLMVMASFPVVGVPLPLISYGGSSLLTTMLGVAILLNVRMRCELAPVSARGQE
ncbi:MAG: rod shape-determining protein RodA [Desulfobulbaceae bacterium]|jgi:rod shape determining protein RodA|nr:rod shape-determining protein RodA [Desulfobulbaceae bacterium]